MKRDKDQWKIREGEGWRGARTKGRFERGKNPGKDREGQGPREGLRGTRPKGRFERDKGQGKDREGQGPREGKRGPRVRDLRKFCFVISISDCKFATLQHY